jgi:hypothetical protein
MTTRVGRVPKLYANVPVDRVRIVKGPGLAQLREVQEKLQSRGDSPGEDITFTLKTRASKYTFSRVLTVATMSANSEGKFNFTAIFSNAVVSGVYDVNSGLGWFNLD